MPPSDDNTLAIADAASSVPLTSSTNDDCSDAVIATNSLTEEKAVGVLESDPVESEDNEAIENSEDATIKDSSCPSEKESKEQEEVAKIEVSIATQQNENSEGTEELPTEEGADVTKEEEAVVSEETETPKEDAIEEDEKKTSPEEPDSKENVEPNPDDNDIEWLTPFSLPKVNDGEEEDKASTEEDDAASATSGIDNPLKMLKKGAVAAVGGSMVGLGLVMIPLPTPFGAVVASSGLAVLGTEFKEAGDLNDRLIDGAKGHLYKARDSIVKGIEKMNEDELDEDIPESLTNSTPNSTPNSNDNSAEKEEGEGGTVVKVNAAKTFGSDSNTEVTVDEDGENTENGSATETLPVWLHMNPIERQRQERLAKQKYRRDRQTSYEQAKEAFTKRTGKFLSKNLLPFIKKAEPSEDAAEQVADNEEPTTTPKSDGDIDHVAGAEKGEDSSTDEKEEVVELEKKDEEPCTMTTNDNETTEGYVVVS